MLCCLPGRKRGASGNLDDRPTKTGSGTNSQQTPSASNAEAYEHFKRDIDAESVGKAAAVLTLRPSQVAPRHVVHDQSFNSEKALCEFMVPLCQDVLRDAQRGNPNRVYFHDTHSKSVPNTKRKPDGTLSCSEHPVSNDAYTIGYLEWKKGRGEFTDADKGQLMGYLHQLMVRSPLRQRAYGLLVNEVCAQLVSIYRQPGGGLRFAIGGCEVNSGDHLRDYTHAIEHFLLADPYAVHGCVGSPAPEGWTRETKPLGSGSGGLVLHFTRDGCDAIAAKYVVGDAEPLAARADGPPKRFVAIGQILECSNQRVDVEFAADSQAD